MKNDTHIVVVDVTLDGKFIGQVGFPFNPLFPIEEESLKGFIEEKYPKLKGEDYKVDFVVDMKATEYNPKKMYKKD